MNESKCLVVNLSNFQFHDESKDVMSAQVSNFFANLIRVVVVPTLFFIGFPSNMVNMVVFFRHGLKQRINLCLFCLSALDLFYVIVVFLVYVEKLGDKTEFATTSYRTVSRIMENVINNRMFGLYSSFVFSSQFVSAVIAGERCLCVVFPLRFSHMLKMKTFSIILLLGVLLIFGCRFVVAMKYHVVCVADIMTGQTYLYIISSEFYRANQQLVNVLDGLVFSLGIKTILFIFVTITTVITAVHLERSTKFQKNSSSSSSSVTTPLSAHNVAVTRMLIYLSLQYIVFNTPSIILRISLVFLPALSTTGDWANLFFFLLVITEVCGIFSSSLNFLIYYFFGSKYRATVLAMFCSFRKRGK
ncbi:uncharacterized protein LOC143283521 [Babylonia areolata]|uniref:uncharacterized protein LOC143283521 n=1 Tax=Babylonia areolata TaxID=304850 RepID=UPI003FD3A9F6